MQHLQVVTHRRLRQAEGLGELADARLRTRPRLDQAEEPEASGIGHHPGVTFALHLCRGNNQSKYIGSGGCDPIAAKVFRASRFRRRRGTS